VTRGGFYAWLKRPESVRSQRDTQLTAAIRTSFAESCHLSAYWSHWVFGI
jgi:hypothetical protein